MYDKFLKIRTEKTVTVMPTPVIIVEGALIFCSEELRNLLDLSVYVDCDDDVRLSRRVLKNAQEDGPNKMTLADLLKTYEDKTKPAFEKFIEPTKKYANTIIPNYGFSTDKLELDKMAVQGVDVIITHIET
jgi:uridine kinase